MDKRKAFSIITAFVLFLAAISVLMTYYYTNPADTIIITETSTPLAANPASTLSSPAPSSSAGEPASSAPEPETVAVTWMGQADTVSLASTAKLRGDSVVQTTSDGVYGVYGGNWPQFTGLRYQHDTSLDGVLQVRIYIANPGLLTKDTFVSAWTQGMQVARYKKFFEKWFKNNIRVIYFDQNTNWEYPVRVAAKIDFTGMNTENLYFYSYQQEINTCWRIESPAYSIDENGYLHFTTPYAERIIITDGSLNV